MGDAKTTPILKEIKDKNNKLTKKNRMVHREKRKCCMFYPEDANKANWDLFMTVVLIYTCI